MNPCYSRTKSIMCQSCSHISQSQICGKNDRLDLLLRLSSTWPIWLKMQKNPQRFSIYQKHRSLIICNVLKYSLLIGQNVFVQIYTQLAPTVIEEFGPTTPKNLQMFTVLIVQNHSIHWEMTVFDRATYSLREHCVVQDVDVFLIALWTFVYK